MSLGTSAIKGCWGSFENTLHGREVPCQPCEQESALQVASNKHCHTEETSVEILSWPSTYHDFTIPLRGGKG